MIEEYTSGKYFFLVFIRPIGISTFDSNHIENSSLAYHSPSIEMEIKSMIRANS